MNGVNLSSYVLGFVGSGRSNEANTKELLEDFVKAASDVELWFPLSEDTPDKDIATVLDWSAEHEDYPLTIFVTPKVKNSGDFDDLLNDDSVEVEEVDNPEEAIVFALNASEDPDEDVESFLVAFGVDDLDANVFKMVTVLDITAGLDVVEKAPVKEVEPEVAAPEPKPAVRRTRRAKTTPEKEEEASQPVVVPSNVPAVAEDKIVSRENEALLLIDIADLYTQLAAKHQALALAVSRGQDKALVEAAPFEGGKVVTPEHTLVTEEEKPVVRRRGRPRKQ